MQEINSVYGRSPCHKNPLWKCEYNFKSRIDSPVNKHWKFIINIMILQLTIDLPKTYQNLSSILDK